MIDLYVASAGHHCEDQYCGDVHLDHSSTSNAGCAGGVSVTWESGEPNTSFQRTLTRSGFGPGPLNSDR